MRSGWRVRQFLVQIAEDRSRRVDHELCLSFAHEDCIRVSDTGLIAYRVERVQHVGEGIEYPLDVRRARTEILKPQTSGNRDR